MTEIVKVRGDPGHESILRLSRRMLVGTAVSYPLLAICYAVGATAVIEARGSLGREHHRG